MKRLGLALGRAFLLLLLTMGLLEVTLRVFPQVIPGVFLEEFDKRLRGKIATGRYPTEDQTVPFRRDDRGFPFRIKKPLSEIHYPFEEPGMVPAVVMDELGFCNPPGTYDADRLQIMALGDSFTWCTTVHAEETWVWKLRELTGRSAYNLGNPGVGLYEHLQLLEEYGLEKQPAYVILDYYEGNDLRDALDFHEYRESFEVNQARKAGRSKRKNSWLRRHSYAVNTLRAAYKRWTRRPEDQVNLRFDLVFPGGTVSFNPRNADTDEVRLARALRAGEVDLNAPVEALERFVLLARERGFTPVVAYTPTAYTVYAEFARFREPELADLLAWFSDQQRRLLAREAERLGYRFVDLTQALQDAAPAHAAPGELLYFASNLHLTAKGHEVAARRLAEELAGG